MAQQQFKAESKRLLDMMINSIYTHKEIFLRELISNASDAIDKLYYRSLKENLPLNRSDFSITLIPNKETRTLTIADNGIGMTEQELRENLGTIAKSGSFAFKKDMEEKQDVDIIGQFGVGFYSAFMVASSVTVYTKAYGAEKAYKWESSGSEGYTIEETEREENGTTIILTLKENNEDENYDEYLDQYHISSLVKKYSDYIRYPIQMDMERSKKKEDSDEYETVTETATLNSMVPLWRRNKSELKPEDYNQFYKEKFMDYTDPLKYIHMSTEGALTFQALLFIPSQTPYNFYTREYEKGLQLYSSGVFIMDKCADLLPEHFRFVKGLVDSQDLSLNISREMLQHDRQLKAIAKHLEKKIKSELLSMLKNDRDGYEKFWKAFGLQIKYGVYNEFGANKDLLKDLLLFVSSKEKKLTSIEEYHNRMPETQKEIYYCAGTSAEQIEKLPQAERVLDKGYEILYLTDDVDEFVMQILQTWEDKPLKNIASGELDLGDEEEKKEIQEQAEQNKDLLSAIKEALGDRVANVKLSERLKNHPVCLSSEGPLSLEMEKTLNAMPGDNKVKAQKILEINPNHPIFSAMQSLYSSEKEEMAQYASLLYNQALLIEGFPVEDPVALTEQICSLMVKAAN